ncbi:MAG: FIG025307: hypothetical protein, partial [uncultured Nocardioidaceae bacterium]
DQRPRPRGRRPARPVPAAGRPLLARALPPDRGGGGARRHLRCAPGVPRRDLRRQGLRGVLRQQRADRGAHRLPRRPARRRRSAVHRRDRGARHQDLLQRGRDPAPPVPCL